MQITNRALVAYDKEISQLADSVIVFLLRARLQDFYKEFGIRIQTTYERIGTLRKKYFQYNEDGSAKMSEGSENEPPQELIIEGMKIEDYMKELDEILSATHNPPALKLHRA